MKLRQARKIIKEGTLDGRHNDYWIHRWLSLVSRYIWVSRDNLGDHRIRKAIVVYEKMKRNFFLRKGRQR